VRELLAQLGFRSIEEAVGHARGARRPKAVDHWKAAGLDLSRRSCRRARTATRCTAITQAQDHGLATGKLDNELIAQARPALERGEPVRIEATVRNVNRTVGTMLGHEVTKATDGGAAEDTIDVDPHRHRRAELRRVPAPGVTLRLIGDTNDYVGKGLSGGRLVVRPDRRIPPRRRAERDRRQRHRLRRHERRALPARHGGERFCVRNSGPPRSSRAWATTAAST
jgi:glutamate synthase (NADPH/NADH) large chain